MVTEMSQEQLTALEKKALAFCVSNAKCADWRPLLERQLANARVTARTEKTVGYYVDVHVPEALRVPGMSDETNKTPMEARAVYPDGENVVFFILYVRDGVLLFLEASSTTDWPENEDELRFVG
jgi:hypothetical protein